MNVMIYLLLALTGAQGPNEKPDTSPIIHLDETTEAPKELGGFVAALGYGITAKPGTRMAVQLHEVTITPKGATQLLVVVIKNEGVQYIPLECPCWIHGEQELRECSLSIDQAGKANVRITFLPPGAPKRLPNVVIPKEVVAEFFDFH